MKIDTKVLYNLILLTSLIYLDLEEQGHRGARNKNCCANCLRKFSIDLNGIWYTIETILKGENPSYIIFFFFLNTLACI